jgi:pimeloyl-ACP methyl ester carboxylesterase
LLLALVAAGAIYQRIAAARSRARFVPPGVLRDVGGHRLHVVCGGAGGPGVLFESGIAASSVSWALVLPEIAKFTTTCAYDRAGFAFSDVSSSPRTFGRILEDLSGVLAHAGMRHPCVLVGHSFGSLIVRGYAARHPDNVAGIVMIDPPTEWTDPGPERVRMLRGARGLSTIGAWLAQMGVVRAGLTLLTSGRPGAPRQFVRLFGPTAARTVERLVGEVRKLPADIHPVVQALWCDPKCFRAMAEHLLVLQREGAAIAAMTPPPQIPLVVISGGHQTPETVDAQKKFADASLEGRHVIADKSGHWVPFDQPELIVAVVRDLVGLLRSRSEAREPRAR